MSIFYVTAWKTGDIGGGLNEHIQHLPDDAWVCVRDGDSMFLPTYWGRQIEDVVEEHGDSYGLIGCMTNRLGGLHQCYRGRFSKHHGLKHHTKIAQKLRDAHWDEVEDMPTLGVAGFFMLFPKSVWSEVGGFEGRILSPDTSFNRAVRKQGYRVGLAKGIYVLHSYRIWEDEHQKARYSFKHLKSGGSR